MKRLFAIILTAVLLLTLLPAAVVAADNEVTAGDFTIWATEGGTLTDSDYSFSDGLLVIKSATAVTVKNTAPGTATTNRIDVLSENANITLAGVNIDVSAGSACAFTVTDQCTGTVTITLADGTVNKLSSGRRYAGLQKNSEGSLVIQGDTLGTGGLAAHGGVEGAGIGGGLEADCSNITISGGTVTAQGGERGAGIGGGFYGSGRNITISGGTVTAKGGLYGAGIGGGVLASGFDITISGGSVKAIAGVGANAIGGGNSGGDPVTPKNRVTGGEDVYLITIANPDSKTVTIDGTAYNPANHKAADSTDTNLYAYLTGKTHIVKIGDDETHYHFANGEFTEAVFNTAYEKNVNSHWHTCTTEGCEITHPVAHSGTDDGDCTTAVTCICGYVLTAAEEAHNWSDWTSSTQEEGKHVRSCQVDGCLQTDTGDCKDENPRDHKCDDCGRTLTDHIGGQATCTAQAVCSICGKGYGELLSCKSHGYSDVGQLEWYHDDVDYVIEKGLMIGYENGTFRPCEPLTRAELVQILYNWAGKPQVEITGQFSDVEPDVWYAKAVSWAYEEGIVNGMGNGKFSPDLPITREQLATMLYRQAGEPETTGTLEGFADGDQASIYAIPALKWAVEQGILQGDQDEAGKTCLRPQDDAKRGEVAAMLHRYIG